MKTAFERRDLELRISAKRLEMEKHYEKYQTACTLIDVDVLADSERDFQLECYLDCQKELFELKRQRR